MGMESPVNRARGRPSRPPPIRRIRVEMPRQAALMRIYTDEKARAGHKALFEVIVCKAKEQGIAGATVLRGPMGFGHTAIIQNASILNLSANLPLVIEIVDQEEKLRAFFRTLESMKDIGLVTMEKVEVLHYGAEPGPDA
jgi:PII-like signaling protein